MKGERGRRRMGCERRRMNCEKEKNYECGGVVKIEELLSISEGSEWRKDENGGIFRGC